VKIKTDSILVQKLGPS